MRLAGTRRGAMLGACVVALACGPSSETGAPAASPAPAPAPQAEATGPPPAQGLGLPATGGVSVSLDGSAVDLRANESPLSDVLQALGRTAGFRLDVGESGIEDRKLTASIRGASLFDVLQVVLRGVDFEMDVAFDPVAQQHHIATLRIRKDAGPETSDAALADAFADLLASADPDVVVAAVDALQRTGDPHAIPEIEPLLDDVDPSVRAAAERAIDALEGGDAAPQESAD